MTPVTLDTFFAGDVSKQQVFDFVLAKIVKQGAPSGFPECSGTFLCRYEDAEGRHCAIGWLDPRLHDFEELDLGEATAKLFFTRRELPFLRELQAAHDSAASLTEEKRAFGDQTSFIAEFLAGMCYVATKFGLDPKAVRAA